MADQFVYNIPCYRIAPETTACFVREFARNGVENLVFGWDMAERCLKDGDYRDFLQRLCRETGVQFRSMHAPCGMLFDLNIPDKDRRPGMMDDHIRCMEFAAELGCRTYTVHVGAGHYVRRLARLPELRKLAADSLEKLVPEAKKRNITLAVENAFEPPNAAREMVPLLRAFGDEPALGACFDAGHANCMTSRPGKDPALYRQDILTSWYETGVLPENNALEVLKPFIVTCHLHDNNGLGDTHSLPGTGDMDWRGILSDLRKCPRMQEMQSEVKMPLPSSLTETDAVRFAASTVRRMLSAFRGIGF